jgi:hypothetical protein
VTILRLANIICGLPDSRISFTSLTRGTWTFVYDPAAGIPAVVKEITPSGPVYYIREPGGELIARVSGSGTHYYHFNDLGSTMFLTDANGSITDKYAYDAWGKTTHEGSMNQPYQFVGQLGYYTHYQDPNMSDSPPPCPPSPAPGRSPQALQRSHHGATPGSPPSARPRLRESEAASRRNGRCRRWR